MGKTRPSEYPIGRQTRFPLLRSDEKYLIPDDLRTENERLRELVVQLTAIILKDVAKRK